MKNVVERIRLVVLALMFPGVGLLVWNHLCANDILKIVGVGLIILAFILSLLPLALFLATYFLSSKWKGEEEK